jgi:hypothetical protein
LYKQLVERAKTENALAIVTINDAYCGHVTSPKPIERSRRD